MEKLNEERGGGVEVDGISDSVHRVSPSIGPGTDLDDSP